MTCSLDLGSVAEWVSAILTGIGVFVAYRAISAWQSQLRGTTRHNVALEVVTAASSLRLHFFSARSPLITNSEFPPDYVSRVGTPKSPTLQEDAQAFAKVYSARYAQLHPRILEVANLIGKAEILLSPEVANALKALALKAREIEFIWQEDIQHKRDGDLVVKSYTDQDYVKRVRDSRFAVAENAKDPLSVEFEAAFNRVIDLVRSDVK